MYLALILHLQIPMTRAHPPGALDQSRTSACLDRHVARCLVAERNVALGFSDRVSWSGQWRGEVHPGTHAFSGWFIEAAVKRELYWPLSNHGVEQHCELEMGERTLSRWKP
jgi:hypothetical protein